jgi:alpha-tubulin suppressor-like RCC1 family protein
MFTACDAYTTFACIKDSYGYISRLDPASRVTSVFVRVENVACTVIALGGFHLLVIVDGKLYTSGSNSNGRTGLGVTTGTTTLLTQVGSDTDWTTCSAGAAHSLAIRAGRLYAFGSNANGRTGLGGGVGNTTTPTQIGSDTDWVKCSAGSSHSLAIRNGRLYSCGMDLNGRTGQGVDDFTNTLSFTQVGSNTDWTDCLASVNNHSLAIRDGRLYSFGANANGRTGLGTTAGGTTTPTQVGSNTDWTAIGAGNTHSLAIRAGRLYAFGQNANGRTGLNTTTGDTTTPVQVGSNTDWTVCSAGNSQSLAIRDSKLFTFGFSAMVLEGADDLLIPTEVEDTNLYVLKNITDTGGGGSANRAGIRVPSFSIGPGA